MRNKVLSVFLYVVEIEDGVFVHSGVAMGRVGFNSDKV